MNSIHMIHIFSNSQARGRIYRIGNGFVVMPVKVVSSLSRRNSGTFRGLEIFDRKIVDVLVHICQDFINEELNCRAVIRFIKSNKTPKNVRHRVLIKRFEFLFFLLELLQIHMGAADDNRFTAIQEYIGESIEKQRTFVTLKASQQNVN